MPQPTRSGKVKAPRRFDKTQLKENQYGYIVHRDYAAHFFRWGWITKNKIHGKSVLDVGCGQDQPMLKVIMGNKSYIPTFYCGVDLNRPPAKVIDPTWAEVHFEFDFIHQYTEISMAYGFDVAVCLEVIEHMEIEDGRFMLEGIHQLLKPGGRLYLSTPVFNGMAALNHIHEYTIPELQALFEGVGFKVEQRFGTFASMYDLKSVASKEQWNVYQTLAAYYGNEVMSLFMAPLYPDASRNNIWEVSR